MREGKRVALLTLALVLGALPARRGDAVNPEVLLMPGKVSAAHQKYEEQCTLCHDRSDRNRQTTLCLDCHKEIAADIRAVHGFHGKLAGIAGAQCRACHSEHLGRDGDIVKLSPAQFDHNGTEFPLRGAHAPLECGSCHHPGKPYRNTPSSCVDCHKQDEPHEGKLGRDCASCHDSSLWRHVTFDHGKTAFPLKDKHIGLACVACHFGNRYKDTPKQCVSCHAPDDVHRGERGAKCADCHTTAGWKSGKFDHAKETGFALQGVHASIDCAGCHRSGNFKDKLPKECVGCHQGQDAHAGRFGTDCSRCHGNEKWKPALFDHTRDTHWPLLGKHIEVACHACHTANLETQHLSHECGSCHRASDVHGGKLGKGCDQCHTVEGWSAGVSFDHDLTRYPLLGLHVAVPCQECHASRHYGEVGHQCIDCHKDVD